MQAGAKMEIAHGDTITLPEGTKLVFTKLEQVQFPHEEWLKLVKTVVANFKTHTWGKERKDVALELTRSLEICDPANCGCPEVNWDDGNAHIYNWAQICAHQNHAEYNLFIWKRIMEIPGLMQGLRQALQRHMRGKKYVMESTKTHERDLGLLNNFLWPDEKRATWTHTKQ